MKTKKKKCPQMDKNVHLRTGPKWTSRGITLIALIITIIILLILAGITVGVITGKNGLIKQAGEAKENTEIANEKEALEKATVDAMGKNKYGNLEESEFQDSLDNEIGKDKTIVGDSGEEFEVLFADNNRYYVVDKDGSISEPQEFVQDQSPGNFTVGEDGEELDGSSEKPYEISSIEDLVVLSNISRGVGNYLKNGEIVEIEVLERFINKKFILTKNLNFNSRLSYADLSITWSYNEEEESYIIDESNTENLKDLITDRTGVGFVPIGQNTGSNHLMFAGIFDGQNFEIQNLYENRTTEGGLFNTLCNTTVKNLKLTNINITSTGTVGGISQISFNSSFYNCHITGNIYSVSIGRNCCNCKK